MKTKKPKSPRTREVFWRTISPSFWPKPPTLGLFVNGWSATRTWPSLTITSGPPGIFSSTISPLVFSIEIIKHLGCNKCILNDQAEKKCSKRYFKNYVSLSLIHKLRKNKTYYEEFDFIPYNRNNNLYKNNKSIELNKLIIELQEIKWNKYTIQDEKWKEFYDVFSQYYPSPILAFKQFTEDNCGIFYDILFLLSRPEQPSYELLYKINSIISKSIWMKLL